MSAWNSGHSNLVATRLDPILSPGSVSSHVHHFVGSSQVTANADFESASAAGTVSAIGRNLYILTERQCTTSNVQADKSIYWTPQVRYF